jgi:hypothetical protein
MLPAGYRYPYVGPPELRARAGEPAGALIVSPEALAAWLADRGTDEWAEPFTFVVSLEGILLLAPRRSEHVRCAGGQDVLAAGEIGFARSGDQWEATSASNHSTGYCPAPESWPSLAAALERARIGHPAGYDPAIVFRRCPACHAPNIVRDSHFVCAICDGVLPHEWNVGEA